VKPKKGKKRRMDQPARIIKLPEVEMEDVAPTVKAEEEPVVAPSIAAAGPQGQAVEEAERESEKPKFPRRKKIRDA